ncbi:putative metal dependent phosphohydrolase [Aeromonas phage CF8]|nr:putative metal dependent phosphohydrolase [Aeromonas phage CF8]
MQHFNSEISLVNTYINKFDKLFEGLVKRDLLVYCTESISMNDPAHHLGHVYDVCQQGKAIAHSLDFHESDMKLVYLACLFHDLGCRFEREFHHLIGYGLTYDLLHRFCRGEFSEQETLIIATAVLEHRSSNKKKPSNRISEVVSVADSGRPEISTYIKRCIQFRLHRGDYRDGEDTSKFFGDVKNHLREKFGSTGYHWNSYPDLGMTFFYEEWKNFSYFLQEENESELDALVVAQFNKVLRG